MMKHHFQETAITLSKVVFEASGKILEMPHPSGPGGFPPDSLHTPVI